MVGRGWAYSDLSFELGVGRSEFHGRARRLLILLPRELEILGHALNLFLQRFFLLCRNPRVLSQTLELGDFGYRGRKKGLAGVFEVAFESLAVAD